MALPAAAQVSVLTYQYDNSRAGANLHETALTKTNVSASQFGKLFSNAVDGYVYAQPLYVPQVTIPGKGIHNVVYVVTEHDSVYAFDADGNTGANHAALWQVSFLNAGAGVTTVPASDTGCSQIDPEIGISGTPVIDPQSATMYLVAMTKETSGSAVSYVQRLHALDITTGAERAGSPVVIQASYPGTGEGGTTLVFAPKNYKQRPGLLLLNGVVYTGWSSHCDIGRYHGWLMGFDAHTLQQVSVYNNTPNGNQGSFWAAGAGPAADSAGNIYVVGGNGSFDQGSATQDLGESYIKLSTTGGLRVADYFTPFNYADLNNRDLDVGSSGVALLPDEAGSAAHPHLMVGAGKEGRVYLLDRDNLGKLHAGVDSQIVQSLPGAIGGMFSNPAYFSQTVYLCGSGDTLKAFGMTGGQMSASPVSQSAVTFGSPGCVATVSANGTANGIVWTLQSSGVLHAYDASNLGNELYNSNQNRTRDALGAAVKFTVPMVAAGKVYAGTQNSLVVYGVLPGGGSTLAAANAASGDTKAAAPGSLVSIYGSGLAQSTATAASFPLPETLAGASVSINGSLAPLLYASPTQLNVQVPFEAAAGAGTIGVSVNGIGVGTAALTVQAAAPGIFTLGQGRAAVRNQDNSVNSASQPASVGSIVTAYVTGLGAVDNAVATGAATPGSPFANATAAVSATVGGMAAAVSFAGLAPGYAGLYQVNLMVPALAAGDYALQITAGGTASNMATISVH